jgi:hypothetical protein
MKEVVIFVLPTVSHLTQPLFRYLWEQTYGPVPAGINICHECDNPACINLNHGWMGTQKENINDMHSKGRTSAYCLANGEERMLMRLLYYIIRSIKKKTFKKEKIKAYCVKHKITETLFYKIKEEPLHE